MSRPKPGQTYRLPSERMVKVEREQKNDSFSCIYVNIEGRPLIGRTFAPGVSLTSDFLEILCKRVA